MTKFKSQALHTARIKHWKASGSSPSLIPTLRKQNVYRNSGIGLEIHSFVYSNCLFCISLLSFVSQLNISVWFQSWHGYFHCDRILAQLKLYLQNWLHSYSLHHATPSLVIFSFPQHVFGGSHLTISGINYKGCTSMSFLHIRMI